MSEIYKIAPSEIIVQEGRIRKQFGEKELRDCAESIKRYGQLQPGICVKSDDGGYELVAGERRLRACMLAGTDFEFKLLSELKSGDRELKAIELEENIMRVDLTWKEKSDALAELHELMQDINGAAIEGQPGGHGVQDTAARLGKSIGIVSEDLELSFWASEIPEVAEAKTKTDAKKIIKRIKETMKRTSALDRALAQQEGIKVAGINGKPVGEKEKMEARLLEYDRRVILGDMLEELRKMPNESFDVVCFDPPWGVDYDTVKYSNGNSKSYSDKKEDFFAMFPEWLTEIYKKMKKDSIMYMFFGIVNYNFVYTQLADKGFETNGIPLIWHKFGARSTRNPDIWPGRCYEPIAYARKGKKILAIKGLADVIKTPMPTPKLKGGHPSAKHPQIYKQLLETACSPGDRVLDPMSGSGMMAVAAESLRSTLMLDWRMIEKDETFRTLSLFNLYKGYENIVGDYGEDIPKQKPDFKTLSPMTTEWRQHWERYPEDQGEMLKWRKGEKE